MAAGYGLITHFDLDPNRLAVITTCIIENPDIGNEDAPDWPCSTLSHQTVFYGSGRIARAGQEVAHAVDPGELAMCQKLSSEVATLMAETEVCMGSESSDKFHPFLIAGNVGKAVPNAISKALIWERFNSTIFPLLKITVEPLAKQGVWWSEVKEYGAGYGAEEQDTYLTPWRRMMDWFKGRKEFLDTAFVRIGNNDGVWELNLLQEKNPKWPECPDSEFPRLALGLTCGGSLVGLFGRCVLSN